MSRGVRDLRDLICVSRLTVRESDDEIISDEEVNIQEFETLSLSSDSGSDSRPGLTRLQSLENGGVSPDSGCVVNGSPLEAASNISKTQKPKKKSGRKKNKKKELDTLPTRHELPKPTALPPVQDDFGASNISLSSGRSSGNEFKPDTKKSYNYDDMMCYMDAAIVSGWLTRANAAVSELSRFCHIGENFVQFAHFWLSGFPDLQKHEIFEMEYEILIDEMILAFSVGRDQRKVLRSDITNLASALFLEYPAKLLTSKGNHLFLDYLDILSSERKGEYRKLLSNVRCSTRNKQYAQWLLATRSFALVSFWSAITNFYRNLTGHQNVLSGLLMPSSVSDQDLNYKRLYQAIRLGYVDVVHYMVVSGQVKAGHLDSHQRTLIFTTVMHNQEKILHYLLTRSPANPNQASDTGNTPLHAAANSGHLSLVVELLKCPDVNVNAKNPLCEGATPLHVAVMHGHKSVVEALIAAKADLSMKMGKLTAPDIAREFGNEDILELLTS